MSLEVKSLRVDKERLERTVQRQNHALQFEVNRMKNRFNAPLPSLAKPEDEPAFREDVLEDLAHRAGDLCPAFPAWVCTAGALLGGVALSYVLVRLEVSHTHVALFPMFFYLQFRTDFF